MIRFVNRGGYGLILSSEGIHQRREEIIIAKYRSSEERDVVMKCVSKHREILPMRSFEIRSMQSLYDINAVVYMEPIILTV
jgi:hypothetical protein